MGNILEISSITDYEDENGNIQVGFGPKEVNNLKQVFAEICEDPVSNPVLSFKQFSQYFTTDEEAQAIIKEIFDLDETGEIDFYKFLCGISQINSSNLEGKAELLWPVYCPQHNRPNEKEQVMKLRDLEVIIKTSYNEQNRQLGSTVYKLEKAKDEAIKLLKKYNIRDKASQDHASKTLDQEEWKQLVSNEMTILKLFFYFGCISRFGGGDQMPEWDPDLEQEIQKGQQDDEFVRIERIKNGIEHSVLKEDGMVDDQGVQEETNEELFEWQNIAKKVIDPKIDPKNQDTNAPNALVDIDYVYGIRCHDTRNNLKAGARKVENPYNAHKLEEVIIYHTSQLGIVQFSNGRQRLFTEHNDDITCIDIRKQYAITGQLGSNPIICLWDYTQPELKSELIINGVLKNGIAKVCLGRDVENLKIAAVSMDDDHTIAVYDVNLLREAKKKNIVDPNYAVLAVGPNTQAPVWDVKFTKDDQQLICGAYNEVGFFTYYGKMLKKTKGIWDPKMNPQSALSIGLMNIAKADNEDPEANKGGIVVTGMFKGQLILWKNQKQIQTIRAHQGACTTIISRRDKDKYGNQIEGIVTGGNDGEIKLWKLVYNEFAKEYNLNLEREYDLNDEEFEKGLDLQNQKISSVFQSRDGQLFLSTRGSQIIQIEPIKRVLQNGHYEGELKGLCCHPSKHIFYTVGQDRLLASWDMNNKQRIDGKLLAFPANSVEISPDGKLLVVGFFNGKVKEYNPDAFDAKVDDEEELDSERKEVVVMKFDPQGQFLVVSKTNQLEIYPVKGMKLGAKQVLKDIENENDVVQNMDISENSQVLRCNTRGNELFFLNLSDGGSINQDYKSISQLKWATCTCPFGWDVNGIWPECSRGSDINTVARTSNKEVIITGDDFSKLKIFNYPCMVENTAFNRYQGHSAAITNIRFSFDDSKVISIGGTEKSIIQWNFYFDENAQIEQQRINEELRKKLNEEIKAKEAEAAAEGNLFGVEEIEQGEQAGAMKPFKGQIKNPTGFKPNKKKYNKKPQNDLKLEWAHGFRTQYIEKIDECRNMCKFTQNGKIAYATAALGVVYDPNSQNGKGSQTFFNEHGDDIVAFAVHPDRKIIATGQMAQRGKAKAIDIFVWDSETMEVLANFNEFHLRAILYLEFSPDGSKLLTVGADDDNSIAIFDWQHKRMISNSKVDKSKVNALVWKSDTEFMTTGAKHIKFWSLNGTNLKPSRGSLGGGSFISQCCGVYNNNKYYTGGAEGSIFEWQGKSGKNAANNVHGLKNKVGSLVKVNETQILSGGYDGRIILWDVSGQLKQLKVVADLSKYCPQQYKNFGKGAVCSLDIHQNKLLIGTLTAEIITANADGSNLNTIVNGHYSGETWGACTAPDDDKFASSGGDNTIRLWDITQQRQVKCTNPFPNDIRAIDWAPNGKYLVAGDFQAYVYTLTPQLEIISGPEKTQWAGKKTGARNNPYYWIGEIRFSPCSKYFAVGFHGVAGPKAKIEIFPVQENGKISGKPFYINTVFSSAIIHMDWSCDSSFMVSNSQAYELRYFSVDAENKKTDQLRDIPKDMDEEGNPGWATWTCKFGWPVQGIFQGVDYTDVNSVCRSHNKLVLATGNDDGLVRLFKYPVVVDRQVHKAYKGHSSHITNVKFSKDDNWLVSTGGNDRTVMLWSTGGIGGEMIMGKDDIGNKSINQQQQNLNQEDDEDDDDIDIPKPRSKRKDEKKELKKQQKQSKIQLKGQEDSDLLFAQEPVDQGDEFGACKPWLGAIKEPSNFEPKSIRNNTKAPNVNLSIEYIFGYRCKDTRNNLRYLSNGNIVYHAAAVGIVLDQQSNSQQFFTSHNDDITAMDLSSDGKTVVTGEIGPKPSIFVWDAISMEVLAEVKQPLTKGICALGFSPDGQKFAAMAVDENRQVAVFNLRGETLYFNEKNGYVQVELFWGANDAFMSCGPKSNLLWELKQPFSPKPQRSDPKTSNRCASVTACKGNYIFGSSDGKLTGSAQAIHQDSVQAVYSQGDYVLSGGNDGAVYIMDSKLNVLWGIEFVPVGLKSKNRDSKSKIQLQVEIDIEFPSARGIRACALDNPINPTKLVVGLYCSEIYEFTGFNMDKGGSAIKYNKLMTGHYAPSKQRLNEVWGLDIMQNDEDSFLTCGDDQTLRRFSISQRKQIALAETNKDSKKKPIPLDRETNDPAESTSGRAVGVNPSGTWAIVGSKDGTMYRFGLQKNKFTHYSTFQHSKAWVSDVKFSPDGKYLCYGAHDSKIYGYNSVGDKGWRLWNRALYKHHSYITHIDFSTDSSYLHSTSGDYELLFWDLDTKKFNPSGASATRDEEWATWNTTLGWPVQGIWPEAADGTDINAVDRSHSKRFLATVDDFGKLNVFNYPCIVKGSKAVQGKGHSSHVTNVKWTVDDSRIITTGGEDQCVFLWKVE